MSVFGAYPTESKEPIKSDEKNVNLSKKLPYQLIIIITISFILYLVCASLGTYVAFKDDTTYKDDMSQKALQGTFTALLGLGIMLPVLYFMYYYTKTSNNHTEDIKNSKTSLLVIAFIAYILMTLTASLGIWLSNSHVPDLPSNSGTLEIIFIVILVLAVLLPFFYAIFFFRDKICAQVMKKT